jgi:DNA invertase Pin-like site-specific DNA recombinase
VGYTRVSTVAQTLEQQDRARAAAGVTKTFFDIMSVLETTVPTWRRFSTT